jgi:hypothetical protein
MEKIRAINLMNARFLPSPVAANSSFISSIKVTSAGERTSKAGQAISWILIHKLTIYSTAAIRPDPLSYELIKLATGKTRRNTKNHRKHRSLRIANALQPCQRLD